MPTLQQIKYTIATEFGIDCDAAYSDLFDVWYSLYENKDNELIYLLMQRHSILFLLGKARKSVDVVIGFDEIKKSQQFKNLIDLLKEISKQIASADPTFNAAELVSVSGQNSLPNAITESCLVWDELKVGGYI